MKTVFSLYAIVLLLASTGVAQNGFESDKPDRIWITPLPSPTGTWVDPTDGTMENGLSFISEPWPSYQGGAINYINLYDPAYGLDPTKEYRIINVQYCIKDKKPAATGYVIRVIIQGWDGSAPTETNLYEQILDSSSWTSPDVYTWTESAPITNPSVILPAEFAIGWHTVWPFLTRFWLGLDTDADAVNWYYYQGDWVPLGSSGYGGAFGCRFEVEELTSSLENTTFGAIKAAFN
ncbi:MAG: hypothetical protein ABFR50_00145 [Candidatus Fermentibacteria bacterium]